MCLSLGGSRSAKTAPLCPFPEPHSRAHPRACPRGLEVGETEQEPGHGGEVVHVWVRASECPRPRLFASPQTAPSSSHGRRGEPERHTARKWTSRPSTWSSSTPQAPPATRPRTAGFASETRRATTWTGWTSVTLAISKWDWRASSSAGLRQEGPNINRALLGAKYFRGHCILFVRDSGLHISRTDVAKG